MEHTEDEAEALLKMLGYELSLVPEWEQSPGCYFRYCASNTELPRRKRFFGDTHTELLNEAIKHMETNHDR